MTSPVKSLSPVYLPTELLSKVAKYTDLRTRKSVAQSHSSLHRATRLHQNALKITKATSLSAALNAYSTGGLEHLDLSRARLNSENIATLTERGLSLISLDISHNTLNSNDIKALFIIRTLEELKLGYTNTSASGLKDIHELTQLKKLDLSGNLGVNDDVIKMLITCPALEELNLSQTRVTKECISSLKKMEKLKKIDLSYNRNIDDATIEQLAKCPNLETVILRTTAITDNCAASLGKMKNIKTLDLSENIAVSTNILARLCQCGNLESLNLSETNIRYDCVDKLIQIPGLERLNISVRKFFPFDALEKLGKQLNLKYLNMSRLQINSGNIPALNAFTCLEELEMRDMNKQPQITSMSIPSYSYLQPDAEDMMRREAALRGITSIPNSEELFHQLAEIINAMTTLKRVDFSGNIVFDDQAAQLISHSRSLESLNLSGTGVGLPGIESMKGMPNLKILKLSIKHHFDHRTRKLTVTNPINDRCIEVLSEYTQLEELDVSSEKAEISSSLSPGVFKPFSKNRNFSKLCVQSNQIDNETKEHLNKYGISVDVRLNQFIYF